MELITKQDDLADFCQRLAAQPFIAVDTEFMREKTYWPILCLIQAAGNGVEGIIDPLADGLDLAPFLDVLAKPDTTKVFHAARQDVEIFYKLMRAVPTSIFDTQIAAMACGFGDQIGYEPLMRDLVGAQIDKGSRFTDWAQRPLTDAQLTYALSDVTHLRDAYPVLLEMLSRDGRDEWVEEEMQALTAPGLYHTRPEEAWTRLKLRNVRPKELGPLIKLAEWREKQAQDRDLPRNRIMKDDGLFELARLRPKTAQEMSRARSVPKGFERSDAGQALLRAVADGVALDRDALPEVDRPERKSPPPADVVDLLRVLLKRQCEVHKVAPKLIANASDIEAIAQLPPAKIAPGQNLPEMPVFKGWRFQIFGEPALKLKRGELCLGLNGRKIDLIFTPRD